MAELDFNMYGEEQYKKNKIKYFILRLSNDLKNVLIKLKIVIKRNFPIDNLAAITFF